MGFWKMALWFFGSCFSELVLAGGGCHNQPACRPYLYGPNLLQIHPLSPQEGCHLQITSTGLCILCSCGEKPIDSWPFYDHSWFPLHILWYFFLSFHHFLQVTAEKAPYVAEMSFTPDCNNGTALGSKQSTWNVVNLLSNPRYVSSITTIISITPSNNRSVGF